MTATTPMGRPLARAVAAALALTLAACAPEPAALLPPPPPAPAPAPPPEPVARPPAPKPARARPDTGALREIRVAEARHAAAHEPGPASRTMTRYLEGVEAQLLARGRLRMDGGVGEPPATATRLVEDFVAIALRDEYTGDGSTAARPTPLHRWVAPVRLELVFGDTVPESRRLRDRALVRDYAARLAAVSGHPVELVAAGGNFVLFVLSEDDRRGLPARLAARLPGMPAADRGALAALPPQNACTVFTYSAGAPFVHSEAVGLIRDELPARSRLACFHEEIAQGLGLGNDSPEAHPSIFNDDDAFAALTAHDEALLAMLYDPRLTPGMTEAEARPIVAELAAARAP